MASMDHKAIIEFKEKIMRGTKILECYSTMQKIKVGRYYALNISVSGVCVASEHLLHARAAVLQTETSEDDIEDAIERVLTQRKVREKLERQVAGLELIKSKEQEELARQRKTFHDHKYSGDLSLNK